MDFNLTDDRRMLSDTLRRFLSEKYDIETRNAAAYEAPYYSTSAYESLAELGVIGAFLTDEQGGFGGAGFDISTVFEELGRGLSAEPMLATLMSLRLLADAGAESLVEEVIGGAVRPAVGIYEAEAGERLEDIKTTAQKSGDNWVLSGRKSVVYGVEGADVVLVVARHGDKLGLFQAEGAEVLGYAMIDGGGAGEIMLDNTAATCLSEDVQDSLEKALDAGRLALCAEAIGAMDVLLDMTTDYLKQRRQFGRPIAVFQALQHRIVDLAVELEQARSIVILAASRLEAEDRAEKVAMAKNLIGRAAPKLAEEAVQMHGGIGMTWEYPGSHYAKRLVMLDQQLGDRLVQLRKLIAV